MGCLLACLIAFFFSLHVLRLQPPQPVAPLPAPDFDAMVTDPVVTGLSLGGSLLLALAFQLERPYWVALTCITVIQGASLRAIWNRQTQRIAGTGLGLLLAEATQLDQASAGSLLQARLLDTVVGSVAGLLGGVVLHTPRLRDAVSRSLRRLTPPRLRH